MSMNVPKVWSNTRACLNTTRVNSGLQGRAGSKLNPLTIYYLSLMVSGGAHIMKSQRSGFFRGMSKALKWTV